MEKTKLYTRTTYGKIYQKGILRYCSESCIYKILNEIRSEKEVMGLAVYEQNVYTDASKDEEQVSFFFTKPVILIDKTRAEEENIKNCLGIDFSKTDCQMFVYCPLSKFIYPYDNNCHIVNLEAFYL